MTDKKNELATFLAGINPGTQKPVTPRDRGVWPEHEGILLDDPVDLHIKLERPVYEWMIKFLDAEFGNSFFFTFEEAIATMIRAMAKDGLDLDALKAMVQDADFEEKLR